MIDLSSVPLLSVAVAFLLAATLIAWAGTKLAHVADTLADRTGMGEVVAGAVFVGASTSLPGIITSVSTAAQGYAELSIGNALGGLTAQTTFLAVADLAYRRVNLEHAAASVTGLTQGTVLLALLTLPLLANAGPEVAVLGVHPVSLILVIGYGFGLKLMAGVRDEPMWTPVRTRETESEIDDDDGSDRRSTFALWRDFTIYAAFTGVGGVVISETSVALVGATGLSESAVGTVFSAVATSLPELVTALAAVRIGAPHLAVGDVIGGNVFDLLFLAGADVAYRDGSIYHHFSADNRLIALLAMLMTAVLLLGMLRRERRGIAGIGFESSLVLVLYAGSLVLVLT